MTKEKPLSEYLTEVFKIYNLSYGQQEHILSVFKEYVEKLKAYINECYDCPTKCEKCLNDILNVFDKIFGSFTLAGESSHNQESKDTHAVCECGHAKNMHASTYLYGVGDCLDNCLCQKFKPKNNIHGKVLGHSGARSLPPVSKPKKKGCDKETAKRCLNFKGFYCDNKDCLNKECPLCSECEEVGK